MNRTCGACTLCCKLVPVVELDKKGGQRCEHQRHTGCAIYEHRPWACKSWNCAWLVDPTTAALSRPDRAGYVIDTKPDFVEVAETGQKIPVLQIWVDPKRPLAHRDRFLRKMLNDHHIVALVRFDSRDAITLWPPSVSGEGEWVEHQGSCRVEFDAAGKANVRSHTLAEIMQVIAEGQAHEQ